MQNSNHRIDAGNEIVVRIGAGLLEEVDQVIFINRNIRNREMFTVFAIRYALMSIRSDRELLAMGLETD